MDKQDDRRVRSNHKNDPGALYAIPLILPNYFSTKEIHYNNSTSTNISSMSGPSVVSYIRQIVGRALRETGQALDRAGARGVTHANTKRDVGDDAYVFNKIISRHRTRMERAAHLMLSCSLSTSGCVEHSHNQGAWSTCSCRTENKQNARQPEQSDCDRSTCTFVYRLV